ncbi:MAG: carbohydrate-binding domain-containing protein [Clostridia bacterium]|nr:carbohydrate-binding domain-containing protein [Clostridia bacterium]
MLKKLTVIFMALVISAAAFSGCASGTDNNTNTSTNSSAAYDNASADSIATADTSVVSTVSGITTADTSTLKDENAFAEGDTRDVESDEANAVITLSGDTGTISDTTRGTSGSEVIINAKGIYEITGTSENVSIVVNDESKSGNIYLILNGVSMTNSNMPCIIVENSEKVIIVCKGDNNTLTYTCTENSDGYDGAIFSEDDLTLAGSGKLTVESSLHGIVCRDDFKAVSGDVTVNAASIGIQAGDSVRIGGGTLTVDASHDGIQVQNKSGDSYLYMENGTLTVSAGYDGIDVGTSDAEFTGNIKLLGGTVNITAGGGSDNSKDKDTSQKGVKCDGDIFIGGAAINVSSADDAVHSNGSVSVSDGTITLSTSDDGITANDTLNITGGNVSVTKSYEALEGAAVIISGGDVNVVSSDDGINAGGGSDTTSEDDDSWAVDTVNGTITISGGNIYVNASGDGLDSNGSIYVSGGTVIVEGPTDNGNGALDKGDSQDCTASITGGTVLAIGSSGMAVNFDSGTQGSALVSLSGEAGTEITVSDGFTFTATKQFECVVYSAPSMTSGSTCTITAGSSSADVDLSSSLYYSNVASMGGHGGMQGGGQGGMPGDRA